MVKDIKHTEDGNKIVVEGVHLSQPNASKTTLTTTGCNSGQANCHPFCRSPIVGQVKHTDVLILDQFVDSKGQMYSQEELEICSVGGFVTDDVHDHVDVAEAVEQGVEAGADVPESWPDAREGVLLQGDQTDQVGEPELLLGRGHHRYTAPYEQDQKKDQRIHNWWI